MSQQDVQKIKDRLGIEEVIGSYITILKSGSSFKARCPFHNEKTPSFFISPERANYYCFGCGAKGDIFSFVQNYEGLDFVGALKVLADRAGVVLTNDFAHKDSNTILYQIMEEATKFFEKNLENQKEATEYLMKRGLVEKSISDWRIGFAKDGWNNLFDYLVSKKYSTTDIERAGLIKKGDKGDYYDRFRSRIIFPIFDPSGRPVAFTGRIFGADDKETAKYLNSPETVLFDKSRILYGFHIAKQSIRKLNFSILVEGQMDTIMAHQVGYSNTIASSGTALTEDQLKIIQRFSNRLVIAYDGDKAGFKAAERAWQIALSLGLDIKTADLNSGDPADIILKDKNLWRDSIKNSKHIIEKIAYQIENENSDKRARIKAIATNLVPYLAQIKSNIEQSHFVDLIGEKFDVATDAIWQDVKRYSQDNPISQIVESEENKKSEIQSAKKRLIGFYFWLSTKNNPEEIEKFEKKINDALVDENVQELSVAMQQQKDELIFEIESLYKKNQSIDSEIDKLILNLKLKKLHEKRNSLRKELKMAEENNSSEVDNILNSINNLSKEINSFSKNKV